MQRDIPELRLEPDVTYHEEVGCGDDVYEGECAVEWFDGKRYRWICEDCLRDKLSVMPIDQLISKLGLHSRTVTAHG